MRIAPPGPGHRLCRILDQIREYPLELIGIAAYRRQGGVEVAIDPDSGSTADRRQFAGLFDDIVDVAGAGDRRNDAAELFNLTQQGKNASRLADDHGCPFAVLGLQIHLQQLGRPDNAGQRVPDFVTQHSGHSGGAPGLAPGHPPGGQDVLDFARMDAGDQTARARRYRRRPQVGEQRRCTAPVDPDHHRRAPRTRTVWPCRARPPPAVRRSSPEGPATRKSLLPDD